jgi:hypothetical protein
MSDIGSDIGSTSVSVMNEIDRPGAGSPDQAGGIRQDLTTAAPPP